MPFAQRRIGRWTMKKLMLGNEAVARGLYEAGCTVVSSYPGTPSTEITEVVSKYDDIYSEWAPNEKVATEVAYGVAMAGARSFCAMKHVGLNVAADPLFTSSYSGVNGGFLSLPLLTIPACIHRRTSRILATMRRPLRCRCWNLLIRQNALPFTKLALKFPSGLTHRLSSDSPPVFLTPRGLWSCTTG